jgi:AbrB family looped-hinge helix DNA binding protein
MRTHLDRAGRVIVPRKLREQLGLVTGTRLEIRACDGRLEIEAAPVSMRLERRGKGMVAVARQQLPTLGAKAVRTVLETLRRRR